MTPQTVDPLELILQSCAQADPEPWYPSLFARQQGVDRDSLDPFLDRLRMGGLIQLTDWVKDRGQGYVLTPEGKQLVQSPRDLARLREGTYQPPGMRPPPTEINATPLDEHDRGRLIRDALYSGTYPLITVVLIFLNVSVFVAGLVQAVRYQVPINQYLAFGGAGGMNPLPGAVAPGVLEIQHNAGAIQAADIDRGQWWRLLTCCFVHFGLIHLAVNMYSLYAVGPLFERLWGRWRYLVVYLLSGLVGSTFMVILAPLAIGAGASGAIWGIVASFAAFILLNRRFIDRAEASYWLRRLATVFLLNLLISAAPGISASGHFGGGIGGAVAAVLLNEQRFGQGLRKWLAALGFVLVPIVCLVAVQHARSLNPSWDAIDWQEHQQPLVLDKEHEIEATLKEIAAKGARGVPESELADFLMEEIRAQEWAREQTGEIIEQLRQIGPYRDRDVEAHRQLVLKAVETQRDEIESMEWTKELTKNIQGSLRNARKALFEAAFVLQQPTNQRPKGMAESARRRLAEAQSHLQPLAQILEIIKPFHKESFEAQRQDLHRQATHRFEQIASAIRCLQEGTPWSEKDLKEFEQ